MSNQAKKDYFTALNTRFKRCLEPRASCNLEPINAHSIQKAQTLELLAKDGHVFQFAMKHDGGFPSLSVELVGKSKATTFTGLCSNHDQEVFRPIDTRPLEMANMEQLFLLAYRSVLREVHAVTQAAIRFQLLYQSSIKRGESPADVSTPLGMAATSWISNAYDSHEYKRKFDSALLEGRFEVVEHQHLAFQGIQPTVAVSALFSLDDMEWPDDVARIGLNVFPDQGGTNVVFSYLADERPYALQFLGQILEARDDYQRYLVSKLILQNTENFVVAPEYYANWNDEKKSAIKKFFIDTIMENLPDYDDPNIYLF